MLDICFTNVHYKIKEMGLTRVLYELTEPHPAKCAEMQQNHAVIKDVRGPGSEADARALQPERRSSRASDRSSDGGDVTPTFDRPPSSRATPALQENTHHNRLPHVVLPRPFPSALQILPEAKSSTIAELARLVIQGKVWGRQRCRSQKDGRLVEGAVGMETA